MRGVGKEGALDILYYHGCMSGRNVKSIKPHSVEYEQREVTANQPGTYSVIPISRHHVANLSLETPPILNRHHIRIISKHTINSLPAL